MPTSFFVRDCVRCGTKRVQHLVTGSARLKSRTFEVMGTCSFCKRGSIYTWVNNVGTSEPFQIAGNLESLNQELSAEAVRIATTAIDVSPHVPERVASLFREANECRQMTWYDASGAMYRKTLDVATKHLYANDSRLAKKTAAQALRSRIKALGEMNILDMDIVELADVAALDGNDAAHDEDPYSAEEAEALEHLTLDLLERLFVRPARLAEVKAKQIASGQRQA